MTRIIRVSSCADCDPYKNYGTYCGKDKDISIHYHVFHKSLPGNCPLEEVVQIITKMEVEERFGSAK